MRLRRPLLLPALAVAALVLGACGSGGGGTTGGDQAQTTTPATTQTTAAMTETTPATASRPGNEAQAIARAVGTAARPRIPAPTTKPPSTLQVADVRKGKGTAARRGDTVTVNYAGASWSTGKEFDASYDRGQPFPFRLGTGSVIPGWDQGVKGMRPGGRRVLVIPPALGYGERGSPPDIVPNETLVFVIDALRVQR